ncbi:MAG: hypothetical protein KAR03_11775 [Candidatus Thorarchaeota archaeon]|nr:hypothetical protein [Candidatus Thorarchaeota archaeon]
MKFQRIFSNYLFLFTISEDWLNLWMKIYFDELTEEPNIIVRMEIGETTIIHLLNREISILVEPLAEGGV